MVDRNLYPERIEPAKFPLTDPGRRINFMQFFISASEDAPVFWSGRYGEDFEVLERKIYGATDKFSYTIVGKGEYMRPECDIIHLNGREIDYNHLVFLKDEFPGDSDVFVNDGLLIRCGVVLI